MKDIDLGAEVQYQQSIYRDRADEWFRRTKEFQRTHPNRYDAIVYAILSVIGFFTFTGVFYWIGFLMDLL